MTPEMIEKAQANARKYGYLNVEFRYGDIEALPVDDSSVDVIISNCVINLAPDKRKGLQGGFPGAEARRQDVCFGYGPPG